MPARLKAWGEALFGGGLVSGLVAMVAAVLAGISGWSAKKAETHARNAETALENATLAFEQDRAERAEQMALYARVEANLKDGSPEALILAAAHAGLVRNIQSRSMLCRTIRSVAEMKLDNKDRSDSVAVGNALGRAVALMRDCVREAEWDRRLAPDADSARSVAATPTSAGTVATPLTLQAAAPVERLLSRAAVSDEGWDIDIFWCEAGGDHARDLAERVGRVLAAASNGGDLAIGGERIGRVRLRALTRRGAERLSAGGTYVAGDPGERLFAQAVAEAATAAVDGRAAFDFRPEPSATEWYVSVFACPGERT